MTNTLCEPSHDDRSKLPFPECFVELLVLPYLLVSVQIELSLPHQKKDPLQARASPMCSSSRSLDVVPVRKAPFPPFFWREIPVLYLFTS